VRQGKLCPCESSALHLPGGLIDQHPHGEALVAAAAAGAADGAAPR